MGRTILSATQTWVEEEKALSRFVRALRKSDQELIDELIALSHSHVAEASYASNLYPMDIYLVSMLLELYKKLKHLERKLQQEGVLSEDVEQEFCGMTSLLELVNQTDPLDGALSIPACQLEESTQPDSSVDVKYIDLQESA